MSQRTLILLFFALVSSQPAFADGFGPVAFVFLLAVPFVIGACFFGVVHLLSGETRQMLHTAIIVAIAMLVPVLSFHFVRDDRDEYTSLLNSAIAVLFNREYLWLGLLITVGLSLGKRFWAFGRSISDSPKD